MSEFFKFLSRKGGKVPPRDPIPANDGLGDKVLPAVDVPQETAEVAKEALDGKQTAIAEPAHLTLKLADFITRIPPHLRKPGEFDPERPLSFGMGWIMGRINRGLSTVPLAKLLDAAPDLFTDDAAAERDLEIQFPWRRVAQLLRESELAEKKNGRETLAQKFRRQFQARKAPDSEIIENAVAVEADPPEPFPVKGGEGRAGENVWYTRNKTGVGEVLKTPPAHPGSKTAPAPSAVIGKNGGRAGAAPSPVPDSAPALMELPSTEQQGDSTGAQFAAPPAVKARHGATPAADLQPGPDLMDLMIGQEMPGQTAGIPPANEPKVGAGPPEVPDSAPALMELERPAEPPDVALPNPGANAQIVGLRHGKSRNEMRIADLEARLSAITVQHKGELSVLRAESERMVAQARADATKFGREGAANFHAERKRIAAEKDEQLTRIQTDLRAVIEVKQNEITELRAARKEALSERQKRDDDIAQLMESREALERENQAMRAEFQKALALTQQHESAAAALRAEHQSALEAWETSRRDDAKALDEIKVESEREIASLRAAADFTALEMEARFKHERGLLMEEKDRTLATMEAEHRAALATRHAGYSAARDGHEKERTDLAGEREAAERRWGAEREMLIKEKTSLAAEYEQRLSALIAEHQQDAAAFGSEAARTLTAAEAAEREEKMARQATEHKRIIDEFQKEAERKTSELQAAFEDERQRIRAENEGATATTVAGHAATLAGKEAEIGLVKNELERILAESATVREKAVSEMAAERDGFAREKEAIIGEHAQRLESIVKQHEEALGELRIHAEQQAAEAARTSREAEIARLKEQHERALAEQATAHEKAAAEARLERDGLARKKEAVIGEHAQRLESIAQQHEDALGALRNDAEQKAAEAEAARVAKETEIARLKEEHERALAEQAAAHEKAAAQALLERDGLAREKEAVIGERAQRLESIAKQHEEALGALRTHAEAARVARETEIARLKEEHERVLAEQAAAHEKAAAQALLELHGLAREKEAAIAEHVQRLENATKLHEDALGALRTNAEQTAAEAEAARIAREAEIARLMEEHKRAFAQQAAAHEKAAAQALLERDGFASEKEALVAEHAQRLDNITKEAVQALRSQAEQNAAEAEAARASREAEIARLKEEHRRALAEQAAAHQKIAAQALLERGALVKEKEAVVAEHAQQIALLATKQADLHAELEAAKTDLDRSAHLLRLQEQNASEVASKHELDLLASGLESAQIVAEQKEKSEKELADLKKEHERALAESVESRARALAGAAFERESLTRKIEADLAERDRKLAAQMKEHQEKLAGKAAEITLWKSEYAGAVDASATACQKLVAERDQLEREKEAVIREREDRLAKLTKKHETALAAFAGLRADFEGKHSEMEAAMASRNAEIAALRAEWEAARTSLTIQRNDALCESAARAEEVEMRIRGAEQFAAEVAQYRERIKTVLAERTALAERLEKERRVHAHAIQGGKEAMERLHTEHDRAAAEQAEKHRNALSGARAEAHQAVAAARAELERDRQEVIAARSSILREITARAAAAVPTGTRPEPIALMAYEKEIRNSRILIMDDVVANLTLLENVLNRMGYKQIQQATDIGELVSVAKEWQPDLVVLELPASDNNRLSAVEQLRAKVPSQDWIPVLVLSSGADHEVRRKAFAAGVTEFLAKPFDFSELVVRIRNSLLMRTYQEQMRNQNRILEYRVAARTKSLSERTEQLEHALVELKNSQQQIVQHERLRAFGAMAGGVAHDFNNVLMCVIGYSELLLNDAALLANTETARRFLRSMYTAGLDASSIVARLRNFYRPVEESDVFTPFDVNSLVEEIGPLTQPKWKAQALAEGRAIEIELDLHPIPKVAGNPAEIREVVVNLVFNAADAMPKGGKITLCTRCDDSTVSIGVRDTGTGMSEEVRQRCMDPFFSTKGDKGTGLGLAMVFGIVKRHEGSVEIESEVGRGTTFWIRLSRELKERGAVEVETAEIVEPLDILVADDDPIARDILSLYLTADGHRVEMATNGFGALETFRKGNFDLVITDQAMPGMTGLQLAAAIKKEASTPILMLTGSGVDPLEGAMRNIIDVIGAKPIPQRDLRIAIATAIQRPQSVGASSATTSDGIKPAALP